MSGTPPESAGGVRSELARLCLPDASRDADRDLAWMNSVCIVFLAIGIVGAGPAVVRIPPAPRATVLPAIVAPVLLPPPPAPVHELAPVDSVAPEEEDTPAAVVAVASDLPEIRFAVPPMGELVVPLALAVAPPLRPLDPPAPVLALPPAPPPSVALQNTGTGGDRPRPPYPPAALARRQQGAVVMLLEADEAGRIMSVSLKASSGSAVLDRSTVEFVRRHWRVPLGGGARTYEATVTYRLEAD